MTGRGANPLASLLLFLCGASVAAARYFFSFVCQRFSTFILSVTMTNHNYNIFAITCGVAAEYVGMDVRVKFGDSRSNCSRDIRAAQFVMDNDEHRTTNQISRTHRGILPQNTHTSSHFIFNRLRVAKRFRLLNNEIIPRIH